MTGAVERAARAFASGARRALVAGARDGARAGPAELAPSLGAFRHGVIIRGHRAVPAWRVRGGIGPARLTASHRVAHRGFAAGNAAGSGKNGDDEESDEGAEEGDEGDGEWEDALVGLPVEALELRDAVPDDQGAMADRTLPVYGITGAPTGETVTLPGRHFDVPLRVDIAHRVVVWQRSKRRGVYAKTLTRSEVSGTTRKARAQKGAGRARVGTLRAPQMRGGGVAHGPNGMRNWNTKLQRRVRRAGLRVALSAKAAEGRIVVLDSLHRGVEPKTQWLDGALDTLLGAQSLAAGGRAHSVLCAEIPPTLEQGGLPARRTCARTGRKLPAVHSNAKRASLNLPHVQVMDQFGLNVYDVLRHRSLAITRDALDALVARLDRPIKPDRAKWSAPQTTPDAAEVLDWTSRGHLREVDKERKKEDVFKRRAAKKAGARV